jgi:tetraacyldisaccharide 4'-kinase
MGEDEAGVCAQIGGTPLLRARLEAQSGERFRGQRIVAFAGIARPRKFFATLRAAGAEIVAAHGFGDHARFDPRILARLAAEAQARGAQLVTTEKDAARLPAAFRPKVLVLPVRLELDDWAPLDAAFERLLPPA